MSFLNYLHPNLAQRNEAEEREMKMFFNESIYNKLKDSDFLPDNAIKSEKIELTKEQLEEIYLKALKPIGDE